MPGTTSAAWHENLLAAAKHERRTPEAQILYWLDIVALETNSEENLAGYLKPHAAELLECLTEEDVPT